MKHNSYIFKLADKYFSMTDKQKARYQETIAQDLVLWIDEVNEDLRHGEKAITIDEGLQLIHNRYVELEEYELAAVIKDFCARHEIPLD